MTDAAKRCPDCGEKLRVRTSKPLGELREQRRQCVCGYQDKAIVEPEKILRVVVVTTTGPGMRALHRVRKEKT